MPLTNFTRLPEFITFTGVDDRTDVAALTELSSRYPIEVGILFSPSRQGGDNRYPSIKTITKFVHDGPGRLSAHLCGAYSRAVMSRESPKIPVDLQLFNRVQVNHFSPDAHAIHEFAFRNATTAIAQCRGADQFPAHQMVRWLYDASGGRGIEPTAWPPHPGGDRLVGYAGGIGPDNVLEVIRAINSAGPYWIDMESGVRTDDWFDLTKVEAVCKAVYGDA